MRCRLPAARTSSRIVCPPTRQLAYAFNQPLSFDTSKVTTMSDMFYVRSARDLAPSLGSGPPRARRFRCRHNTPTALSPPGPHAPCPASYALLATRQDAPLSNANKLLIRCAWEGNPDYPAYYGSNWAPGHCA